MIKNSLDLGSNSITNNVNAMSLARNAPVNAILGLQNQGAMPSWYPEAKPRDEEGIAPLILKAKYGIDRCVPSQTHGIHIVSNWIRA